VGGTKFMTACRFGKGTGRDWASGTGKKRYASGAQVVRGGQKVPPSASVPRQNSYHQEKEKAV